MITPNLHIYAYANDIKTTKKFVGTANQGSNKNQGFTAGLVVNKTPNLHIYAYANCLIISAITELEQQTLKT